jgi:hypothetical protein
MEVRVIAFYLPQFHPIPENDKWWGKGFTEWTNVTQAKPLFKGHYQPHLPADLGFYDLRLPEVREAQAEMAKNYRIEGFCYWHYWFSGKRLLDRPLNEVLTSGKPNFPFCIGWANESWTRSWEGDEKEIIIKQQYSPEDDLAHARWLTSVFSDSRYISISGRPLFVIYRPPMLPDARRTIDTFRSECVRLGMAEPYIVGRDTHYPGVDMREFGCDITETSVPRLDFLFREFTPFGLDLIRNLRQGVFNRKLKIYNYSEACERTESYRPKHPFITGFLVGWDNTPRRGRNAVILNGTTPQAFGNLLRNNLKTLAYEQPELRIIFVNAWNEWAEGMHLEPDQKWGYGFLEALKVELSRYQDNAY